MLPYSTAGPIRRYGRASQMTFACAIMCRGSHTSRSRESALSASAAMDGPMPQPGAVRVICTSMALPLPGVSEGSTRQSYTNPRSTMLTGISGSKHVLSLSQAAFSCLAGSRSASVKAISGFRAVDAQAERVGVFFGDARQTDGRRDGVAAAERLRDDHRGPGGQRGRGAGGNLDGFHVPAEGNFGSFRAWQRGDGN